MNLFATTCLKTKSPRPRRELSRRDAAALLAVLLTALATVTEAEAEAAKVATPAQASIQQTDQKTHQEADRALLSRLKQAAASADSFADSYDAEVWLAAKDNTLSAIIKNPAQRLSLLKLIHAEAIRAGLQPEIVLALIEVESRFDNYAVSRAGAQGIMQVMPFWEKEIGRPQDNLIHTQTNLRYGCTILKYYLDKEQGRLADALARYNGSYGQYWYAERVLDAWANRWR